MARRWSSAIAWVGCCGCGFDVPPASYLNGTELVMVRHAVELGPLAPERAGPTFVGIEDAPIAEVLPGDRLWLEAVVADVDGRVIPADELETLWLQCGFACERPWLDFADPLFDVRCAELDPHTTDDYCLLGTGDGRFELEVPEFGPYWALGSVTEHISFYGVVAWAGRRAEDCWAQRRGDQRDLDRCGFIEHRVAIGPQWPALAHAASLGVELPIDPAELPSWVLLQPANRVPRPPSLRIMVDGERVAEGVAPLPPIRVEPGATIGVVLSFDPVSQSIQQIVRPLSSEYQGWELIAERLYSRTETSGAIRHDEDGDPEDGLLFYQVDPDATAGTSRVLIIDSDDRGAADFVTLEFVIR
ncbi:MAG TPA: hypothetical protein VK034_12830 [Enhygromyxa sp.]|nr:hypothetical protein [Enhygromyxa sp.]